MEIGTGARLSDEDRPVPVFVNVRNCRPEKAGKPSHLHQGIKEWSNLHADGSLAFNPPPDRLLAFASTCQPGGLARIRPQEEAFAAAAYNFDHSLIAHLPHSLFCCLQTIALLFSTRRSVFGSLVSGSLVCLGVSQQRPKFVRCQL